MEKSSEVKIFGVRFLGWQDQDTKYKEYPSILNDKTRGGGPTFIESLSIRTPPSLLGD